MTESAIIRQILDYLAAEKVFAFRLNTSAFTGEHKGKSWFTRSHSLGKGAADILAIPRLNAAHNLLTFVNIPQLIPVWIECKTAKGKQSPEQKSFQEYVQSLGHRYVLARSVDDVRELWEARGK